MSVQTEIERLKTAKADLKAAIEEKGVTVPDYAALDDYGALVQQIPAWDDRWTVVYCVDLPSSPPAASTRAVPVASYRYLEVDVPEEKDSLEVAFIYGGSLLTLFVKIENGAVLGNVSGDVFAVYARSGRHLVVKINVGDAVHVSYRFTNSPQ